MQFGHNVQSDEEIDRTVQLIWNNGSDENVACKVNGTDLTRKTLKTIQGSKWFNYEVINAYLVLNGKCSSDRESLRGDLNYLEKETHTLLLSIQTFVACPKRKLGLKREFEVGGRVFDLDICAEFVCDQPYFKHRGHNEKWIKYGGTNIPNWVRWTFRSIITSEVRDSTDIDRRSKQDLGWS